MPLAELVRVAGARWTVEETFQRGKGLTGLDNHQLRRWTPWQRRTLITMLAHALLAVPAAERAQHPCPDGLIALTCNEICHLFNRGCARSAFGKVLVHLKPYIRWHPNVRLDRRRES